MGYILLSPTEGGGEELCGLNALPTEIEIEVEVEIEIEIETKTEVEVAS